MVGVVRARLAVRPRSQTLSGHRLSSCIAQRSQCMLTNADVNASHAHQPAAVNHAHNSEQKRHVWLVSLLWLSRQLTFPLLRHTLSYCRKSLLRVCFGRRKQNRMRLNACMHFAGLKCKLTVTIIYFCHITAVTAPITSNQVTVLSKLPGRGKVHLYACYHRGTCGTTTTRHGNFFKMAVAQSTRQCPNTSVFIWSQKEIITQYQKKLNSPQSTKMVSLVKAEKAWLTWSTTLCMLKWQVTKLVKHN